MKSQESVADVNVYFCTETSSHVQFVTIDQKKNPFPAAARGDVRKWFLLFLPVLLLLRALAIATCNLNLIVSRLTTILRKEYYLVPIGANLITCREKSRNRSTLQIHISDLH